MTRAHWVTIALICICAVVLYPYTRGGLVWDDHMLLTDGLWKIESIATIWLQSVQGGTIATQYYRPIPMTIFALVQNITVLHILTLCVHLGSIWLLGEWLRARFDNNVLVNTGMLLFGLHPIQTEVLGWASCLPDILAVHFGLWAVWCARRERGSVWVGLTLMCGLLSKEIALLPLVAFGADQVWGGYRTQQKWTFPRWMPFALVALTLIAVLRTVFQVETVWPHSFETVPRTTAVTIGMGWFSWLVPFPHYPVRDVWSLPMWAVYLGWAWCVVCLLTVRSRMGWLIVMGGLILSLPPVWVGYFAAERYLYVASIGFVWITCTVLSSSRLPSRVLQPMMLCWVASTAVIHWKRAPIWSSDAKLFAEATQSMPKSGYTWHLQGMSQIQSGDFASAFESFTIASQQEHTHHQSAEFASRSGLEAGMATEAFEFAEQGPKEGLSRGYLEAWLQAAQTVGDTKRTEELMKALGL